MDGHAWSAALQYSLSMYTCSLCCRMTGPWCLSAMTCMRYTHARTLHRLPHATPILLKHTWPSMSDLRHRSIFAIPCSCAFSRPSSTPLSSATSSMVSLTTPRPYHTTSPAVQFLAQQAGLHMERKQRLWPGHHQAKLVPAELSRAGWAITLADIYSCTVDAVSTQT